MRRTTGEKVELIRLVEGSDLSVRQNPARTATQSIDLLRVVSPVHAAGAGGTRAAARRPPAGLEPHSPAGAPARGRRRLGRPRAVAA